MFSSVYHIHLIDAALHNSDCTGKHCVNGKEDVIGFHWNNALGVFILVFFLKNVMKNIKTRAYKYLNTVNPEECDVVAAVESEANNVQ